MRRREFIVFLGGAATASSLLRRASAQQPKRMWRIGVLNTITGARSRLAHFEQGLRDLGYVEGRNIILERRTSAGQYDQLNSLAAELVALKVDAIFAVTLPAAQAAQQATKAIPIVFVLVADPIGAKLVTSIPRPGGNISGVALFQYTTGKRLEMFKEAIGFSRVAALVNPTEPTGMRRTLDEMEAAAVTLKVSVRAAEARSSEDLPRVFSDIAADNIDAVFVATDAVLWEERKQIADLALRYRMASMFGLREHVDAGGLMSYGPNFDAPFHRAASYVDKILKGEKPADLAVEQPTKFDLLINLKTAKILGLNLPPKVLSLADEVIE